MEISRSLRHVARKIVSSIHREEEEIAGRKAWFTKVPVSRVKRRDPAAR